MKTWIAIILLFFASFYYSFSQQQPDTATAVKNSALNIFLDCNECDFEYFKTSFTSVNYVNDVFDADVHILVASLPTGSGGLNYSIRLIGKGRYKMMIDTVTAIISEDFSADESRQALLDKIRLGLVPYLLKTPYSDKLFLSIDSSPVMAEEKDPWKNWVFDISGSGSFSSQKYAESYSLNGSLYVSKITGEIKIESSNYFAFNESKFSYFSDDTLATYSMSQQDLSSQNLLVKSLGDHFGAGGFTSFGKSEYSNLDFQMITGPAVEYNIFSYDEASTRQCRIMYAIMYEHSKYNVVTVYDKLVDDMFRQDLTINFTYYEPWGTVSASAFGTAYLDDLSQYSLGASAIAYFRLFKGLSLNVSGGIGYCRNQRSLRQVTGDLDDYLTGQWEMEQGLSYSINIGVSYRFGSKNNNAVNARFGF